MDVADLVAKRSLCSRAQVGCVVVTSDNRIEAATYNGPSPQFQHFGLQCEHWCQRQMTGATDPSYSNCPASHAEANAIARSDWTRLNDATLYVSGAICITCAKLITQTGIAVVYHHVRADETHRNPELVERYLRDMMIEVIRA